MLQLPQPEDFRRGIYIIESGNNDYIHGNDLTPLALDDLVAAVVDHIKHAIKVSCFELIPWYTVTRFVAVFLHFQIPSWSNRNVSEFPSL